MSWLTEGALGKCSCYSNVAAQAQILQFRDGSKLGRGKVRSEATVGACRVTHSGVCSQADALAQDAMEVARLARSSRNTLAPINRMPREIFSLIPQHFRRLYRWQNCYADRNLISMTHVCRRWREVLTSCCPSLWTHPIFNYPDRTHVYIERSQSLPLKITLIEGETPIDYRDSFLEAVPYFNRLGSLTI